MGITATMSDVQASNLQPAPGVAPPLRAAAPAPKGEWNCCLWTVLVMGVLLIVLGIVIAAMKGFSGTTAAGVMLLIAGVLAIPVFALRAGTCGKSMAVTFGVVGLILCIVGGILAGWTGFWGAVLDAICDDYQNNKSNFYICDVAANDE